MDLRDTSDIQHAATGMEPVACPLPLTKMGPSSVRVLCIVELHGRIIFSPQRNLTGPADSI